MDEHQAITRDECERLFSAPQVAIGHIASLSVADLAAFVEYVFERAGYKVTPLPNGQWAKDMLLSSSSKQKAAYVRVVAYNADGRATVDDVRGIQQRLSFNEWRSVPVAFLITAGYGFTPAAVTESKQTSTLRLVAAKDLERYVRYVRGSRLDQASTPPLPLETVLDAEQVQARLRPRSQTKVLALANNKGGVGKTTTALNIAFDLARREKKVLLVDLDAQANLTYSVPYQKDTGNGLSLGSYFSRRHMMSTNPLPQMVRPTEFPGVSVIPGNEDLRLADGSVGDWTRAELQFASDLHDPSVAAPKESGGGHFDWIIIDTPPVMSLYTRIALGASHYVVVPAIPSAYASTGVNNLLKTADAMQALLGSGVEVLGCVVTHWDGKRLMNDAATTLEDELRYKRVPFFDARIPYDQRIEEAHRETHAGKRRSIFELARRPSPSAEKYHALVSELLDCVQ